MKLPELPPVAIALQLPPPEVLLEDELLEELEELEDELELLELELLLDEELDDEELELLPDCVPLKPAISTLTFCRALAASASSG